MSLDKLFPKKTATNLCVFLSIVLRIVWDGLGYRPFFIAALRVRNTHVPTPTHQKSAESNSTTCSSLLQNQGTLLHFHPRPPVVWPPPHKLHPLPALGQVLCALEGQVLGWSWNALGHLGLKEPCWWNMFSSSWRKLSILQFLRPSVFLQHPYMIQTKFCVCKYACPHHYCILKQSTSGSDKANCMIF